MVKRFFLVISLLVIGIQSSVFCPNILGDQFSLGRGDEAELSSTGIASIFPSARRGGARNAFFGGVVPPMLRRVESTDLDDYARISQYVDEDCMAEIGRFALRNIDPAFDDFLREFVALPGVSQLLNVRPGLFNAKINMVAWFRAFRSVCETVGLTLFHGLPAYDYDICVSLTPVQCQRLWIEAFGELIERFGGCLFGDASSYASRDISIYFPATRFSDYLVSLSVQPARLGYYDVKNRASDRYGFNCNAFCTPGCRPSELPCPVQELSRVPYSCVARDYIGRCGITNVSALEHWFFTLAGDLLDDQNVFVIRRRLEFDLGFHRAQVDAIRSAYTSPEALRCRAEEADVTAEDSLIPNLVKVIRDCGLWSLKTEKNLVFVPDDSVPGRVRAVIVFQERPAYGGGKLAFYFQTCDGVRTDAGEHEEVCSNARVGLNSLLGRA